MTNLLKKPKRKSSFPKSWPWFQGSIIKFNTLATGDQCDYQGSLSTTYISPFLLLTFDIESECFYSLTLWLRMTSVITNDCLISAIVVAEIKQ